MAFQYNGFLGSRQLTRQSTSNPLPYRPMTNTPLRGNSTKSRVRTMMEYPQRQPPKRVATPVRRPRRPKKYKLTKKIPRSSTGSSSSYYTVGRMKMSSAISAYWKRNQKFSVNNLFSSKLQVINYNQQAVSNLPTLISSDFNDDLTRALGTQTPKQKSTTSLIYGTVKDITTFTNVELTTSYLQIYEITPRYNFNQNPVNAWSTGLSDEEDVTAVDSTLPYNTPFVSQQFCLLYKVNKVYQIQLGPGETHKHVSTYHINRLVYGMIANMSVYTTNFTYWRMYVASGTPINDKTNKSFVGTSSVSIDIVTDRNWFFGEDARPRTQRFVSNALNNITSAQVVSDSVIEADGDA